MTVAYTPKDAVLDVVAVALILAPEPLTTPIGISLLMRKRGDGAHETTHPIRLYPEYVYKVDTIRGREITWEVRTIQTGQLPLKELNKRIYRSSTGRNSYVHARPLKRAQRKRYLRTCPPASRYTTRFSALRGRRPGNNLHSSPARPYSTRFANCHNQIP